MTTEQALSVYIAVTTFFVTGTNFLVRKWLQKHRDEAVKELTTKVVALQEERHELGDKLQAATEQLVSVSSERDSAQAELEKVRAKDQGLTEELSSVRAQLAAVSSEQGHLQKQQRTHDNRIRRALALEGAIWTQPLMAGTAPFRPLAERRTPIISLLNLKGGVGKTTLTAYLGWALA